MDAFLKGKKRKSETPRDRTPDYDDESTDIKLAMLASLFPGFGHEVLLEALLAHDGSVESATLSLKSEPPEKTLKKPRGHGVVGSQTSLRNFASITPTSGSPKKAKLLSRKGATLHLYDPEDIAQHTPCSVVHNFLPQDMANDLLREMLEESKTFEKVTFKIFDNVVSSPHTSTFYVETEDELNRQKTEYYYNGARLTVSFGFVPCP
jgi:hypothetical protein